MIANRLIVHLKVYQEFTERFVTAAKCLRAGDPAAGDTDIGPVINASQLSAIQDKLDRARAEGARQLLGTKASGIGRFGGEWAIGEFTTKHWVSVQHQPREYPLG